MPALELLVNGQKCYTAGGADYQTVSATLALIHTPLPKPDHASILLSVMGFNPEPPRAASWPIQELSVGDRIEIRIVEEAIIDAPEPDETPECDGAEGDGGPEHRPPPPLSS